jgi:hypothetical protein
MAASAAVQYGYDSRNKRVWSATISNGNMTQFVHLPALFVAPYPSVPVLDTPGLTNHTLLVK